MTGPREAVHAPYDLQAADTRRDKSPGDLMSRRLMRILGMISPLWMMIPPTA